jgi:SNF2 family DNA or RNA helicase
MAAVLARGVQLKDQQARDMPWLTEREGTDHAGCLGGFNFDDPGTGKLLFVSLIMLQNYRYRQQQQLQPSSGPSGWWHRATLVVAPSVVVAKMWIQEVRTRIAAALRPKVLLYHGANRRRHFEYSPAGRDVIATTYLVLSSEHKAAVVGLGKPEREALPLDDKSPLFHPYHRLVLDEAHQGRNSGTRLSRALGGQVRWAISASPAFNSIEDLMMPLRFLGVRP